MATSKQLINIHVKRYVEAVFEKRLREEGFTSPNDKNLCWYRVNGELINSIIFYSCWSSLPVNLDIGYGIHPLFQKPAYTTSAVYPQRPLDSDILCGQLLVENCPVNAMGLTCYSSDIQVYAPGRDGRGAYTLDGIILPEMNSARSIEDCYMLHKQRYIADNRRHPATQFTNLSAVFIDEALYVDDSDVYPYCAQRIEDIIELYQRYCLEKPDQKEYRMNLQEWEERRTALFDGGRKEYLGILERRRDTNLNYLRKKLGITLCI